MTLQGIEGLSGKLRDDFLMLVRKHAEEEVGHSQAAILSQLQHDRNGIAAALEKEKSEICKFNKILLFPTLTIRI